MRRPAFIQFPGIGVLAVVLSLGLAQPLLTACSKPAVAVKVARSDFVRLLGPVVELTEFEKVAGRPLALPRGAGTPDDSHQHGAECTLAGYELDFRARLKARVAIRNWQLDPGFLRIIKELEEGRRTVPQSKLEAYGAMYRLGSVAGKQWSSKKAGEAFAITGTFEYSYDCPTRTFSFRRMYRPLGQQPE